MVRISVEWKLLGAFTWLAFVALRPQAHLTSASKQNVIERQQSIEVLGQPQRVMVYPKSKAVCIAVGTSLGERIEVKAG